MNRTTTHDPTTPKFVGARRKRIEDPRFLTGRGSYIDDLRVAGVLHTAFVRSPLAHALIKKIDASDALDAPGLVGVFTSTDLAVVARPMRARCRAEGYHECDTPILAYEKVRYVGEPVVGLVANSRYEAEDAAEMIFVDYEPLTPVMTTDQALDGDAPRIHEGMPANLFNEFKAASGDVEKAFANAHHLIELDIVNQRYGAVALEGRAVLADFSAATNELIVWLSSQTPHIARTGLAEMLMLQENKIRVISPDVGGGFGPKCLLYQEDVAVCAFSKLLGRPVKWVSDRREDLQATVHGREQRHRIRAAADADGQLLGVQVEIRSNNGAYAPWPFTAGLDSGQASENVPGPYDFKNYECDVKAVITNKTPMGPYRGVGRVIACMSIESVMNELARRCDLDPIEVRRRNLVREFPYDTPSGLRFESGDYLRSLELLKDALDYDLLRSENERLRADGIYRGVGVALAVEHSAYGKDHLAKRKLSIGLGYDTSTVRMEPDGKVIVAVGLHSHGQGQETTIAQIAADELGVTPDDVRVVFGDTAIVPYGVGTWASRSTVYCGGATILASGEIREKILLLAADMLEANPQDLELGSGVVHVRGATAHTVTLKEVAHRANHEPHLLPNNLEPGLQATRKYMAPDPGSFSSAMHAAVVEVDVDTGQVRVLRYVVVEDCGRMVNPLIVEGQIHGGVAQGLGGALLEEFVYDENGQMVTSSLMDYLLPSFTDVPTIEVLHIETPSPNTLGGFKGMGEGGAINAPAAIVGAINDALSPWKIVAHHTPVRPDWIVDAVRKARGSGGL